MRTSPDFIQILVLVLTLIASQPVLAEDRMNYFALPEWATPEAVTEFQEIVETAPPGAVFAPAPPVLDTNGDLNSPSGKFGHDNTPIVCYPVEHRLWAGQRVNVWIGSSDFVPYLVVMSGSSCQEIEDARHAVLDQHGESDGTVAVAQAVFKVPAAGHYRVLVNDMNDRDRSMPGRFQVSVWFMTGQ